MSNEKTYLTAIRNHCKKCSSDPYECSKVSCDLHPHRDIQVKTQQTFFKISDKSHFHQLVLIGASSFAGPFFWSELRKRVSCEPIECNWWGGVTHIMKKRGFKIIPGIRKSEFKERKGYDRQWMRIGAIPNLPCII